MIDFWQRIAVAVPFIIGVWALFLDGMILGWLGKIFDRRLPEAIQKPLYACPPCLSSTWGSVIWFGLGGGIEPLWLVFCLALCGILKIVTNTLL